jgi:hypothetical protein
MSNRRRAPSVRVHGCASGGLLLFARFAITVRWRESACADHTLGRVLVLQLAETNERLLARGASTRRAPHGGASSRSGG